VHIVGSLPFRSAEDVFRSLSLELGDRLRRIPDGETGARMLFAGWQTATFARHADFEPVPGRRFMEVVKPHRLRSGTNPSTVRFSGLGFAAAAKESYAIFKRLRSEGVLRPGVRFQVSLPTPVNCLAMVVAPGDIPAVEGAYEAAMLAEIDEIAEAVPPHDLAVQWDCPWEVRVWGASLPRFLVQPWFADARASILERLVRLGAAVPAQAELGYHLCHGDYEHTGNLIFGLRGRPASRMVRSAVSKVLRELTIRVAGPLENARTVAEMSNALIEKAPRPINFLHLPAPRAADSRYFAPLADLRRPGGLELYLGLVHFSDGLTGSARRASYAERFVGEYGLSTECGWGRRDPETIPGLIDLHRRLSAPIFA
jgi:hypothetical protein